MESNIERFNFNTKQGNILNFIFNTETNVLIIDLIEKSGAAENQFIWRYIDENALLEEALEIAQ